MLILSLLLRVLSSFLLENISTGLVDGGVGHCLDLLFCLFLRKPGHVDVFGSMSDVDTDRAPPLAVGPGLGMRIGQGAGGLESGRLTRLRPRWAVQAVLSLLVEYGTSRIRSDGHLI